MDLRGGHSLWLASSHPPEFGPLTTDLVCDVAVVGSGITGALAANELASRGLDTAVVDRRPACRGSTAACTALVQYELDCSLVDLTRTLGWSHAAAAYRACRRAIDDVARLAVDVGGCGLVWRRSLYLAKHRRDAAVLQTEAARRQRAGIDVSYLSGAALNRQFCIRRPAALLSDVAYGLDPVKLTSQLLRAATQQGCRVFTGTPVEIKSMSARGQRMQTQAGFNIRSRRLIVATGYETPEQFGSLRGLSQLRSTFALATKPLAEQDVWPEAALVWEMGDPYCYARTTADRRVILGGADADFIDEERRDKVIPQKIARLIRWAKKLCPDLAPHWGLAAEPPYSWAGTFAQTRDGLPYIGSHRGFPGCFFALGYGGNGIVFSALAAQIIADQIMGISNGDANLFSMERRSLRAGH